MIPGFQREGFGSAFDTRKRNDIDDEHGGAKRPLILTIVYGGNESSRRNYSRRATIPDEMIMIIDSHKFPSSFYTPFLALCSPLIAARSPPM